MARRATAGGAIHPSDGGGTDSGGALAHTGEAAASGRGTIAGKNADLATSGGGGETPRRASSRQTPRQKAGTGWPACGGGGCAPRLKQQCAKGAHARAGTHDSARRSSRGVQGGGAPEPVRKCAFPGAVKGARGEGASAIPRATAPGPCTARGDTSRGRVAVARVHPPVFHGKRCPPLRVSTARAPRPLSRGHAHAVRCHSCHTTAPMES